MPEANSLPERPADPPSRSGVKSLFRELYFSKRFNRLALRAYSILTPPPYLRPGMEFDSDVWNGISTFCSSLGRPIGENNAHPSQYALVVDTDHKVCQFEGTRNGLPVNMTALKEVMAVWRETVQFITLLRQEYVRRRGLNDGPFTLRQSYLYSKIGAALPAYQARRKKDPLKSGSLPPIETAFFTLGVGPFMVVRALMEKGDLTALHDGHLNAEQLYQVADESGAIVTPAGKACAGSKKLFLELLDVAMNGVTRGGEVYPDVQRALDAVGDWDAFYDYLLSSSRLELLVKLHQALCSHALDWLKTADGGLSADAELAARFEACRKRCDQRSASPLDGDRVTQNLVTILLALLEEMDDRRLRQSLEAAAVLNSDGDITLPASTPDMNARYAAAQRIRVVTERLHPFASAELDRVQEALSNYQWHKLSLDNLYSRSGGPELKSLVSLWSQPKTGSIP